MKSIVKYLLGLIVLVSSNIAVAQSCNISFSPVVTGTSCSNLCDGSVILNPSGGTAPYTLNAFDHNFPGSSVNSSVFDVSSNANYLVGSNMLTAVPNTSISTGFNNAISTKQAFTSAKIIAEASFNIDKSAFGYWGFADNSTITSQNQFPICFYFSNGSLFTNNNGNVASVANYSASTWYDLRIEKTGSTVSFYIRQTGLSTYSLISSATTTAQGTSFKLAATYRNLFSSFGGFKSMNWKIGGNPPTTNLCPGTYSYTVYDAAGCYASTNITIGTGTGPSSLLLGGAVTPASCSVASDGAINLTPTGGSGPYSFGLAQSFSGSTISTSMFEIRNGNFSQNNELREGINTNSNNGWDNSIVTRQTFSDGGYLNFEGTFKFDASCDAAFGFTDSSALNDLSKILIGFQVSGGTSLYATVNGQELKRVATLVSGTSYDFKIEKKGNAVKFYKRENGSVSYDLIYSTSFPSTLVEYRFGVVNYSSFFSGSAGYNTKNWSVLVTPKVTRLSVGTYTYTITDANGCTATTVFAVGQATVPVELTADLVSPSVVSGATGQVSLTPRGGNLPYKYQFEESFSDTILNTGWLNVRNGFFEETNSLRSSNVITGSWNNSLSTNVLFTDGGLISFSGSFKFDAGTQAAFGLTTNASVINDPSQLVIGFLVNGTQLTGRAGRSNNQIIATISTDTWYDLKVEKVNGIVRFYLRNTGSSTYNLIYTIPYNDNLQVFKAGLIVFGTSAGMNTKDWVINSNPSLTGLAAGTYAYTVYDVNGCYATATINVPAVSRSVIAAQPVNSAAWNVCDGSVTFTNVPVNSTIYNIAYEQSFAGTQLPGGELTVRNGAYSVNGSLLSSLISASSNWDNSIATSASYTDNGYISAEMDMRFSTGSDVYFGLADGSGSLNSYTKMAYGFYYAAGKLNIYTAEAGPVLIGSANANTFYSFKTEKTGSTVKFYVRTPLDNDFQLIYTTTTSNTTGNNYRAGVINNSSSQTFSSKSWVVLNSASLNNLCLGKYNYRIASPGVSPVAVPFTVNTNVSIVSTMTIPSDISVNTNTGVAYATGVALGNPGFSGSSSGVTVTNNAPAQFPLGITSITWTATDEWGNTATGIQKVTVADREAPVIIAPADVTMTVLDEPVPASDVNLGSPVTSDNVGVVLVTNNAPSQYIHGIRSITWTARDAAGNISTAVQKVTIIVSVVTNPNILPQVIAPANVNTVTDAGKAYATQVNIGSPTFVGSIVGMTVTNNAPSQFPVGTTIVTWKVTNILGNFITATQTVKVVDAEVPTVSAPNITVPTNNGVSYATGVNLGTPVIADNVGVTSVINDAPAQFPLGATTVTWTAKDAANNVNTAKQIVTVVDREAPSVVAPASITVPTNSGVAYATNVDLGKPFTGDNVGVTSVINDAPSQLTLGKTTITWTVKDAAGNTTTGTQTVTVVGPPTIVAPANMVVPSDEDESSAIISNLGTPTVSGYNYVVVNNGKGQYNIGANTVTWTVTDEWNRTATAIQTITVAGAPTIVAPADTTIAVASGSSIVTLSLGTPTYYVYNNTSVPTNNAPLSYAAGTTNIVWTITDQWGRTASDVQVVNVIVPPAPSITAPPSITLQNDPNQTYATINSLGTPTYYAFGSQGPTNNAPLTGRYNIGTNYVIWTVKDQFNRTASATQTIIVNTSCSPYSVSIASVLNSTIITGSGPNVIYLGYGAQYTTLQATVPSINGPYTFSWSGPAGLSNYTSASPIFTPTKEGSYTFVVTAKNAKGCTSSSSITICVKDVRVLDINGKWDGKKVYVCHLPPGNPGNKQILSVSINAVAAHVPLHGGDGLGKTCTQPCSLNNAAARGTTPVEEKIEVFSVKAYPNPSADFFSLVVKSTDQYTRISVRIMDAFGRTVQIFNNVTADKAIQFGDKYASGAYYAEVMQGEDRKVIPLMKAK